MVRHLNRVGVLAFILDGLREENINVEEMENTIFAGAEAACCSMLWDEPPSDNLLDFFRGNPWSCTPCSIRASRRGRGA